MLEEDDALAAETASKEDEDAAGLEGRAGTGGTNRFANLMRIVLAKDPKSWLCSVSYCGTKEAEP